MYCGRTVFKMPKTYVGTLAQSHCPFCGLQSSSNEFIKDHVRKHVIDEINAEKIDNEVNVKKEADIRSMSASKRKRSRNSKGDKNGLKVKVENNDRSNPSVDTPHPVTKSKDKSDEDSTFVFVGIGENEIAENEEDTEEVGIKPEPMEVKGEDVPWMNGQSGDPDDDDFIDIRYYEGTKYDCHLCGETFEDNGAHLCFNHGMVKCSRDDLCNFFFGNKKAAHQHEVQQHGDKKQQCAHCERKFEDLYSLIDHRKIQHSLHSCLLCNFILTGEEYYLNHMKKHNITIKEIFKADRPLLDKLLNMSLATFNRDSNTVDCNLCVSWNRNDRFPYARKTVEVHEGGQLIWQHFQHIHKMKDPHNILLATFNGQEFSYSNLPYGGVKKRNEAESEREDEDPDVPADKVHQPRNRVKQERKTYDQEDEANPDDPDDIEGDEGEQPTGSVKKEALSISFNKIKVLQPNHVKKEVKTESTGSSAKRPRKIVPRKAF